MFRALIVTAVAGAIGVGLAPIAAADSLPFGPAVSGPSYGINPEPPRRQ